MINGFERETHELTEYEISTLLQPIINGLRLRVGKQNEITSTEIISKMSEKGYKIDAPRLRKIISHIRINGLVNCIIATSKGYYIADSERELRNYVKSLDQRINQITLVRDSISYQTDRKFKTQ